MLCRNLCASVAAISNACIKQLRPPPLPSQHEPGAPRGPCYSVQAADDVATAAWELLQRVHSAIAVCMACSVRPRP